MKEIQKYNDEDNCELILLINGIRKKDEVSILKLYDDYSLVLFGVVNKIIINTYRAKEVFRKVFIKVCDEIYLIKDINNKKFFIWLYNTARNEAIKALKTFHCYNFKAPASNTVILLRGDSIVLTLVEDTILTLISNLRLSCLQIAQLLQLPVIFVRKNIYSGYSKLLPSISATITKSESITGYIDILRSFSNQPQEQYNFYRNFYYEPRIKNN